MEYNHFCEWLVSEKKMSKRGARDVASRCRRVCRMLGHNSMETVTIGDLCVCESYSNSSTFIKSQLKRAVSLWKEYEECNE